MKIAETDKEAKAEAQLVKELTGEIIARADANKWSRADLAARAKKKSAIALYNWRNGTRKNPSLLDMEMYANAVGLHLKLVDIGGTKADGAVMNHPPQGTANLKPQTERLQKIMERASDELRNAIMEKVDELLTERASHPLDADGEQIGPPVRR